MHNVDLDLVEMSLDVIKYAIARISDTDPKLGFPVKAEELKKRVGETITPKGIGGEKAFKLFRDVLVKASVPIDHPRHLAFVPASPTRSAVMFDLVTSATSVHGAFWLEGAVCIFAENQAMDEIIVPVNVQGVAEKGIIAYEFDLRYDPAVKRQMENPVELAGTVSRGLTVVTNAYKSGLLRVVVYGAMPIDADGVLMYLRFELVGKSGSVSPIVWDRIMFNEEELPVTAMDGRIELAAKIPASAE